MLTFAAFKLCRSDGRFTKLKNTAMHLKPGDKVRFLNEKGGGIVTSIISNTMVNVAIEEGFEVPVLAKDVLLIEPEGAAGRFFDRQVNVTLPAQKTSAPVSKPLPAPVAEPQETSDSNVRYLYRQSGAGTLEGIHLAFVPFDQKLLISGDIEVVLVNNTAYEAIYSLLLKNGEGAYAGSGYDVVPPWSGMVIGETGREQLESWCDGIVQVLFHQESPARVMSPLHAAYKAKPVRFYKESSYISFPLLGEKALVINLGDLASQVISAAEETLAKSGIDAAARQKVMQAAPPALIDLHRTAPGEAEVDLHISALRADYTGMQNSEILLFQMGYFSSMLESAIAYNYKKVVFIHGIGNGTLRTSITSKLGEYENLQFRSAPFAQYGNGAIEVSITAGS